MFVLELRIKEMEFILLERLARAKRLVSNKVELQHSAIRRVF